MRKEDAAQAAEGVTASAVCCRSGMQAPNPSQCSLPQAIVAQAPLTWAAPIALTCLLATTTAQAGQGPCPTACAAPVGPRQPQPVSRVHHEHQHVHFIHKLFQ